MTKIATPRTTAAATALLERFAKLDGERAAIEATRNAAIAAANAVSDTLAAPIRSELDDLRGPIEAWFEKAGRKLLAADRKSLELGGCMIGHRLGNKSVVFGPGDDKVALAKLQKHDWAKPLIRITYAPDKTSIRKELEGKQAARLKKLGFKIHQPETFFLEPVAQAGTITS